MHSVMEHRFSEVPKAEIQRSVFNRTHGLKTTFDAGNLVPIFWDEALPGDTHNVDLTAFARLATPIVPIMDNIKLDFFFFSVPVRLLWENWEKFIGARIPDPDSSIDYLIPTVDVKTETEMSLSDYLGLPIGKTNAVEVSALWHRAYNKIWNDWFRDGNLQDSVAENTGDGPDNIADYTLLKRGKRHDYFTSSLPWPQRGDAVELPLGSTAPIMGIGTGGQTYTAGPTTAYEAGGVTTSYTSYRSTSTTTFLMEEDPNNTGFPNIYADLTSATASTINSIREAFQLQRMLEKDARGGAGRYVELIKSHFNVTSPDFRLQRPEYLGGGSIDVNINPVAQTSSTDATTPQGNLSAFGTATGKVGFNSSFTEHCVILGLVSARADLTYQQGIDKPFLRQTRYDYFWPTLAHISEQPVLNKEIYFDDATPANNDLTFGYQEAYADYRYKPSKVTGLFKSDATGSLDVWHLSQDFSALPVLNSSFIEDNPPIDRVIATPTEPHFIYDSYIQMKSVRPMPVFGVPGMVDHF